MKMSALRVVTASSLETKGLMLVAGEPLADPRHHLQAKHLTYVMADKVSDIHCAWSPETYAETYAEKCVSCGVLLRSVSLQLKPRAHFIRELIKQTTCLVAVSPSAVLHEQKLLSQDSSLTVLTSAGSDTSGLQTGKKAGGCATEFTLNS